MVALPMDDILAGGRNSWFGLFGWCGVVEFTEPSVDSASNAVDVVGGSGMAWTSTFVPIEIGVKAKYRSVASVVLASFQGLFCASSRRVGDLPSRRFTYPGMSLRPSLR
jgi:hypothetical protein